MNFLGMGPAELLLVLALALIVFGPDRMPEIARQIGKTVGDLRRVSSQVTRELQRSIQEEQPASGPRIVRQDSPSTPSSVAAATPPAAAIDSSASEEPRILPPASGAGPATAPENGGASPSTAPTPPVQGSWEDGPALPTTTDHRQEPRRTA